jgi:phenylalanyl-tRNA synthetase beta chain
MRVPFEWLRTFVPVTATADEVAEKLTMRGLEIEGLEKIVPTFAGVRTAEVVSVEKHPSADKLSLCHVNTGGEILPIVCGAPNVAAGQKVALASPGALVAGMSIEKRALRGVDSYGMLCSEKELGLSDDHGGIFILPDDVKLGQPLSELFEISDSILEVNVPPNRGDCQSILGIAREVASAFLLPLALPTVDLTEDGDIDGLIDLSVLDSSACPRYVLRVITDVTARPSPFWMKSRIIKAGMRPINSIVDVTNYIMLELGQPLHAFDFERIESRRIEVKIASGRMTFRTLDGNDRKLEDGDILICDGAGPVALAGVMGGENSEINPDTRSVALESAYFNPLCIRRTARRLDLRSEASARFEKGIDIENVDYCARRAIDLIQKTSGGTILRGSKEFHEPRKEKLVSLNFPRTSEIIGTPVPRERIVEILTSLGIMPTRSDELGGTFFVPSYRHDLDEDCDLIEEVARVVGYSLIPATAPVAPLLPVTLIKEDVDIDTAKELLTACGLYEVVNFGFFSTTDITKFRLAPEDPRSMPVPILNPISKELNVMRTFLAPSILENLAYNINRGTKNFGLFEVSKVFRPSDETSLAAEGVHLCCGLTGREREYFWRESYKPLDFFDLKGILEQLFHRFGLSFSVRPSTEPFLERSVSADLYLEERKIGWFGQISDTVAGLYDIKESVWCAEVSLAEVSVQGSTARTYTPIPRYPAVTRDFSFSVDDNSVTVEGMSASIRSVSPLIVSVGVFDLFKKGVKSVAFRVVFQSYEETLTDERVNDLQKVIIDKLTQNKGIKLR